MLGKLDSVPMLMGMQQVLHVVKVAHILQLFQLQPAESWLNECHRLLHRGH